MTTTAPTNLTVADLSAIVDPELSCWKYDCNEDVEWRCVSGCLCADWLYCTAHKESTEKYLGGRLRRGRKVSCAECKEQIKTIRWYPV